MKSTANERFGWKIKNDNCFHSTITNNAFFAPTTNNYSPLSALADQPSTTRVGARFVKQKLLVVAKGRRFPHMAAVDDSHAVNPRRYAAQSGATGLQGREDQPMKNGTNKQIWQPTDHNQPFVIGQHTGIGASNTEIRRSVVVNACSIHHFNGRERIAASGIRKAANDPKQLMKQALRSRDKWKRTSNAERVLKEWRGVFKDHLRRLQTEKGKEFFFFFWVFVLLPRSNIIKTIGWKNTITMSCQRSTFSGCSGMFFFFFFSLTWTVGHTVGQFDTTRPTKVIDSVAICISSVAASKFKIDFCSECRAFIRAMRDAQKKEEHRNTEWH